MKKIVLISICALVFVLSGCMNNPKISLAEFDSIEYGMTYLQVCGIIGSRGELLQEADSENGGEHVIKLFKWEGEGEPGANANVMFQDGEVISKAQYGLK